MKTRELICRYEAMRKLHEIGGCGAEEDSWADGWDSAITAAIKVIASIPPQKRRKKKAACEQQAR